MTQTMLGASIVLDGEITGEGAVVVCGAVAGRVSLDGKLVIRAGGRVDGDVAASDAEVQGELRGNVDACGRVDITETATVAGDIRAPRVHIADGAVVKGTVDVARADAEQRRA